MNFLQRLILGKELVAQLQQKAAFQPGVKYGISNGRIVSPDDNKLTYVRDGYSVNDIIYAVVNIILDKVRLPEWNLYNVVDESSLKQANRILTDSNITVKNYKKALKLKEQALEPVSTLNMQAGKLNDLLKYPNECETFQDFITYGSMFKLLTGDMYIWAELLKGGANNGVPNSLWTLPSQFMTINCADTFPAVPLEYWLNTWNQKFSKEEILHEIYPNPNWDVNGQQLYGFAPLRAFLKNTSRNNSAKDASTSKFQNGGLDTIVYFDDDKVTQDPQFAKAQMDALKTKMAEEYSGPLNQGKRAFTGYKVGAQALGLSPVDLGIIDSEKWDAVMFCNGYGVPPELLGLTSKTFNNVIEAEKALTTRSAIPLLTSRRNALNRKIQTDWGFKGTKLYIDYSTDCFTELEADVQKMMDWMSKVTAVKPNEEREAVGLPSDPDPLMDELWILQGTSRVPLSDFQANIVDQQLMNQTLRDAAVNGQTDMANGNAASSANGTGNGGVSNGNAKDVRLTKVV